MRATAPGYVPSPPLQAARYDPAGAPLMDCRRRVARPHGVLARRSHVRGTGNPTALHSRHEHGANCRSPSVCEPRRMLVHSQLGVGFDRGALSNVEMNPQVDHRRESMPSSGCSRAHSCAGMSPIASDASALRRHRARPRFGQRVARARTSERAELVSICGERLRRSSTPAWFRANRSPRTAAHRAFDRNPSPTGRMGK
jgi:hypothetical protein